jgi:zinc D-Ala-D-Ala carboxypeptidase
MTDSVAAINARIAGIQSRLAQLDRPAVSSQPLGALNDDFGQILNATAGTNAAIGPAGTTGLPLTPAERRSAGSYGPLSPPPELVMYGNGRVPAEALQPLETHPGHSLWAPAATAFDQMVRAAEADGIEIGMTDSYRPLSVQERLAQEKGLYSQGGLAATPGTSNHGWGLATDLDLDADALAWMRQHGPDYGFVEDVPREPWHWTYRPAT